MFEDILDDQERAASKRRQFIALLAFAIVTMVAVLVFGNISRVTPARRPVQAAPAPEDP